MALNYLDPPPGLLRWVPFAGPPGELEGRLGQPRGPHKLPRLAPREFEWEKEKVRRWVGFVGYAQVPTEDD